MYNIIKYISSSIRNIPSNHYDHDNVVLERTGPAVFTKAIIETIIKYTYPSATTSSFNTTTTTTTTTFNTCSSSSSSNNKKIMRRSTKGNKNEINNNNNHYNYPHVFLPRSILNNNGQIFHLLIDSVHIKGVILPYDAFSFHSQHKSTTKKYPILTKHEYQGSWKSNKKVQYRKKQ
jgi:hypothetical protein